MKVWKLVNEYRKSPAYKQLSSGSKVTYEYAAERLINEFGEREAHELKRSDFIKYMNKNASTPAAANVTVRFASVVFGYGMDTDVVQFNPVARLKKLETGSHKRWSVTDVKKLVALDDRRVSVAVAIAWYTGQREGDILGLKWKDYRDGYIHITQQKTGLQLKLKAHPDLESYLDGLRGPENHYIVSGPKKLNPSTFRYAFHQRAKDAGVDKVFHGIRKGVACALAENGRPLSEIAAMLGHKTMRMAAYYTEQSDRAKLAESAVKSLESLKN